MSLSMAMEKARPKRSGSAAARFARSRRAQTGEQVLTSTRSAMNSSAANQARQHNPAAAPGIAHHPRDHHGRGTCSARCTDRSLPARRARLLPNLSHGGQPEHTA
jgi:hypothetical protein